MVTEIQNLAEKLDLIKSELDYIRNHMVEKEDIMNSEELEAYKRSFDKKNLVSLEDAEKKLGL